MKWFIEIVSVIAITGALLTARDADASDQINPTNNIEVFRDKSSTKIVFLKVNPGLPSAAQTAPITRPTPSPTATPIVVDDPAVFATAKAFLTENKALLGISDVDQELVKGRTQRDQFSNTHVTFHQKHNGLWVFGGELKVHLGADGLVTSVSNKFVDGISLNTTPAISAEAAKVAALDKWNADGMMRNGSRIIAEPVLLIYPKSMIQTMTGSGRSISRGRCEYIAGELGNDRMSDDDATMSMPPVETWLQTLLPDPFAYRRVRDCDTFSGSDGNPGALLDNYPWYRQSLPG